MACFATWGLVVLPMLLAAQDQASEAATDRAFQQAAAIVSPSVVRIDTVGGREQLEPGMVSAGATTGLIVSADGYLLSSAFHFVSQPTSILVTLPDGRRLAAREIATDRHRMVTLLKVDAERLPVPVAAPRDSFRVGQWAIALGRTFQSELPSISVGIVSALDRVWGKAIQTDAKISPVNYGGPLIDIQGRVLGLLVPLSPHETGDTAGVEWYDSGIGFAVPLVDVLALLDRLKGGEDLLPGQLGITFKGKDLLQGEPVIDRVRFGAPAEKGGLKTGDRILSVENQPITRVAEFRQVLGRKYGGDPLHLEVQRDQEKLQVDMVLVGVLEAYVPPFLGILPTRIAGADSLKIRRVLSGSPAEKAGLQAGDLVESQQGQKTTDAAQLAAELSKLRIDSEVALKVLRNGKSQDISVVLGAPPTTVVAELPADVAASDLSKPENLKTGRLAETFPGHDRPYWMYVPEIYRPEQPAALVVYLHPTLSPNDQGVLAAWKSECERRGMILLCPQSSGTAGWTPNDLEFVTDLVKQVRKDYVVAVERSVVMGQGNSAMIAAGLAFRFHDLFRGLALIDTPPLGNLPENTPERSLQIYSFVRGETLEAAKWPSAITQLRKKGYPAILSRGATEAEGYPTADETAELARWVDSLDHI